MIGPPPYLFFHIFLMFLLAGISPIVYFKFRRASSWILSSFPIWTFLYFVSKLPEVLSKQFVQEHLSWVDILGINLSFRLDGLSLLLCLLVTGIGSLIVIYTGAYLRNHRDLGKFYAFLLMFMASMLGLVLSDNVIVLFVFWELTTLSSYFLIGFDHESEKSRKAALQALLVTRGGGLVLLAGFILLGQAGNTYTVSNLIENKSLLTTHSTYIAALLFVIIGAFTKSAQFPFHFWLPVAMQAPTPASAYLHSATMVKAGIYLMARFNPIFGDTQLWKILLILGGALTMLTGSVLTLRQTDLKLVLAYMTVFALGALTMLIGIGTPLALQAMLVYLVVHSLYKGSLFLVVGILDHELGTREIHKLRGLRHALPLTAIGAVLACGSMAGLPPWVGFIGKELIYNGVLTQKPIMYLLIGLTTVCISVVVASAATVGIRPFMGQISAQIPTQKPAKMPYFAKQLHEAPFSLWLGPILLGVVSLLLGVFPKFLEQYFIQSAISSVTNHPITVHLKLWHGWNAALGFSICSLVFGTGIYFAWDKLARIIAKLDPILLQLGSQSLYERSVLGLNRIAQFQTYFLQNGSLRNYLSTILVAIITLASFTLIDQVRIPSVQGWSQIHIYEWLISALIGLGAMTAIQTQSPLAAVTALGVVGYGVALIYVLFGAPDLAMTQFLVETLSVILFALILVHLPGFKAPETKLNSNLRRIVNSIIAISFGALMTGFLWVALDIPLEPSLAQYFSSKSLSEGHGRNIVNVILVDFRALDTLGEITIIILAGLGVVSLTSLESKRKKHQ